MKKNLLYLFTVLCTLSFFTACSDDDENQEEVNLLDVNTSYSGETLVLKYSDNVLLGKEVAFDTKDGKTATISMKGILDLSGLKSTETLSLAPGVIPGEVSTTISNIALILSGEKYTFEGTDIANGREMKYTGEVEKGKLTMSLDVTMPDNALIGTWKLAPFVTNGAEANASQPIYSIWESATPFKLDIFGTGTGSEFKPGDLLTLAFTIMPFLDNKNAHQLLLSVLEGVTFNKDGNIVASYSLGTNISSPQWTNSPSNLAQYYVKDDMLYLLLNPNMILGGLKSKANNFQIPDEVIGQIITEFMPMLSTGIPLSYKQDGNNVTVYANTELVMKLFQVALPLLQNEEIMKSLMASIENNKDFKSFAPMLKSLIEQLPGVVSTTTKIELGINIQK